MTHSKTFRLTALALIFIGITLAVYLSKTMTGKSQSQTRVIVPTPIYSESNDSGSPLATIPASAVIDVQDTDADPWLRICVHLGAKTQCGFVHKSNTNWQR
jgi:hypothetical protein